MNIQITHCLLGFGVLLTVMSSGVVLREPLGQVVAQEAEAESSAEVLLEGAIAQLKEGDPKGALEQLEIVFKLYQAAGDQAGVDLVLRQVGEAHSQLKKYELALNAFQLALESNVDNLTASDLGWLHNRIGVAHMRLNQYEEAEKALQQAMAAYRQTHATANTLQTLRNLGATYRELKHYEQAIATFQDALEMTDQSAQHIGWLHNQIGVAHFRLKQYEVAEQSFQLALAAYQRLQDRANILQSLKNLGNTYKNLEQYEQAIITFKEALAIATEEDKQGDLGWLQNQIGIAHFRLKQYAEASKAQEQAIVAYKQTNNVVITAQVFQNLGLNYRNLEQPQEAIQALEKSIEIWEPLKNYAKVRESLKHLALVQRGLLQQVDLADTLFERALTTFELEAHESSEPEQAGWLQAQNIKLLVDWGQAYQLSGESFYGLELVKQAWEMRQRAGKEASDFFPSLDSVQHSYGTSLDSVSISLVRQARYEEAIDYKEKAYQFVEQSQIQGLEQKVKADQLAGIRLGISTAYKSLENYEKAIENLVQTENLLENYPELQEKFNLGISIMSNYVSLSSQYFESGYFEKAKVASRRAIEISATLENKDYEIYALSMAGSLYKDMNRFRLAIPLLEKALEISQTNKNSSTFDLLPILALARVYYSLDQYPKALKLFSQALAHQEQEGDWLGVARTSSEISDLYSNQGEYRRAYEAEKKYLIASRKAQPFYSIEVTAKNMDKVCENPEDFAEAGGFDSINLACESPDTLYKTKFQIDELNASRSSYLKGLKKTEAEVLNSMAVLANNLGDISHAVQLIERAISIATNLEDTHSRILYKKNLGGIYRSNGDYIKALALLQKSLEEAPSTNDERLIASILGDLSLVYEGVGDYQKAIDSVRKSLGIYERLDMQSSMAIALSNLSSFQDRIGESESAQSGFEKALSIFRELELPSYASGVLSHLGILYYFQGNFDKSLQLHQEAIKLASNIDGLSRVTDARSALAMTYAGQARYAESLEEFRKSLKVLRESNDKGGEAAILGKIGILQDSLGQFENAEQTYREALSITQSTGAALNASTLQRRIANNFVKRKRYGEAITIYQDGLAVARDRQILPEVMHNLQGIGTIHRQQKQWAKAEATLTQALDIAQTTGRRIDQAALLTELGRTQLGQGKTDTAETTLTQALDIAQDIRDPQRQAEILSELGELYTPESPEMAIALYKQSVNTYETIRSGLLNLDSNTQQSYTNTIADTYRALASLLLQQGRTVEALTVLDLLKVQELQDFLKNVRGQSRLTPGVELLPEEQQILETFKTLIAQQTPIEILGNPALQTQLKTLRSTAAEQNLRLKAYEDLQTRLKSLGQNSALLYPLILDDRVELVVFTPDRLPIRQPVAITQANLQDKIQTFTKAIAEPRSKIQPIAQDLYQLLIEPVDAELQAANIQTLIYAPDGQMRYVPLAALHDGKQWLGQRYQLNYLTALALTPLDATSTAEPTVLAGAVTQPHTVSVFGQDYAFAGLRYTQPEVESVATQLTSTTQLVDEALNRQQLQSQMLSHSIVHLATHAKFTPGTPEDSFILLGDGKTISLREIQDWELPNVALMVLSACETALGKRLGNGLEILGFGYQMQRTGSRAAIASLWSIDDGGTQIFMNAFYAGLSQGMSKVKAVQAAQQALITNDYTKLGIDPRGSGIGPRSQAPGMPTATQLNHPYYWAPFILIGNGL